MYKQLGVFDTNNIRTLLISMKEKVFYQKFNAYNFRL